MSTPVTLREVRKLFGKTVAVDGVNLDIAAGSLFFLLGPSGCGKTTLLRMIAGFTQPTEGSIVFDEENVTHLPANKRNCGMVFQSYALWPHMTVAANVAFGLDVRKVGADEKAKAVERALRTVQMAKYADRKPNELSGGQQQRVALARALVIEPTVLLLDEPLSNLDAKLRLEMREQIREICKLAGITGIYVTHDQKEALSMADSIAVMRDGQVVQTGKPREIYDRPANRFVADFLGETNFLAAEIAGRDDGKVVLNSPAGNLHSATFPDNLPDTGNITCSIRPEAIRFADPGDPVTPGSANGVNRLSGSIAGTTYLGEMAQHRLEIAEGTQVKMFELNPRHRDPASTHDLVIDPRDVVILRD